MLSLTGCCAIQAAKMGVDIKYLCEGKCVHMCMCERQKKREGKRTTWLKKDIIHQIQYSYSCNHHLPPSTVGLVNNKKEHTT